MALASAAMTRSPKPPAPKPLRRQRWAINDDGMLDLTDPATARMLAKELTEALTGAAAMRITTRRAEATRIVLEESGLSGSAKLALLGYLDLLRAGEDPGRVVNRATARKYRDMAASLEERLGGEVEGSPVAPPVIGRRRKALRAAQVKAPAADR